MPLRDGVLLSKQPSCTCWRLLTALACDASAGAKTKSAPRNDMSPFNGIHRVFTRCSQKTNSEGGESLEEQLMVAQLHGVKVRICAAE